MKLLLKQQQQLERVKKWLQLRNRDVDRRSAVEERRKKREEEAKVKIEELLKKEKERAEHYQQRAVSQVTLSLRTKPDVMSQSTDVLSSTRRAVSASRPRILATPTNQTDMTNRRTPNHSPVPTSTGSPSHGSIAAGSHHLNPINERTQNSNDIAGTATTTAATTDSSLTGREETNGIAVATNASTNVERRAQSVNRSHLNDTIRRLSKPKPVKTASSDLMAQSVNVGMLTSQSSHQLRTQPQQPTTIARRAIPRSNATATQRSSPKQQNESHTSITPTSSGISSLNDEMNNDMSESATVSSDICQPPQRTLKHSEAPRTGSSPNRSTKPPISSNTRLTSKPKHASTTSNRSIPSSLSSSSLSTSVTAHNNNSAERLTSKSQSRKPSLPKTFEIHSKKKPISETTKTIPTKDVQREQNELFETAIVDSNNNEINETDNITETSAEVIINNTEKDVQSDNISKVEKVDASESSHTNSAEPIDIDSISNVINNTHPSVSVQPVLTKREQQQIDEQDYQRKLAEKRREARERFEEAKRLEEERQRQLELEEQQREEEQRKLEEEQ
ncbi:unnamed protein product, partial [Didymodactylos carnosus]